jgi:hypothetical protein
MSGVIPPLSLYVCMAYRDNVTFTEGLMAEQHFPFTKGLRFKILAVEFWPLHVRVISETVL